MPRSSGESAGTFVPQCPQVSDDPLARALTRAIEETLAELRACKVAKDRASHAQALRNLRETYHLVTGLERPGIRKGGRRDDNRRRNYVQSVPEPADTPQPSPDVQPASPPAAMPPDAGQDQPAGE
jgi:hypothetical protein